MAFFKRKQKNIETPSEEVAENEEDKEMTTLEQVHKAYEGLSDDDKKTFHQSLSDRVHESIAAQERADGNKDSQSAKDREHEALGAEHADERRAEHKDAKEDAGEIERYMRPIMDKLEDLSKRIDGMERRPEKAGDGAVDKLREFERKFTN